MASSSWRFCSASSACSATESSSLLASRSLIELLVASAGTVRRWARARLQPVDARAVLERAALVAAAVADALRRLQRLVDRVQQPVVLPVADRERDAEHDERDDQPIAELVEVLDEAQPVLMADRPQAAQARLRRRSGDVRARGGLVLRARLTRHHLGLGRRRDRAPVDGRPASASGFVVVLVLAGDRVLELAHPGPRAGAPGPAVAWARRR